MGTSDVRYTRNIKPRSAIENTIFNKKTLFTRKLEI
jgi:hypothetical protein